MKSVRQDQLTLRNSRGLLFHEGLYLGPIFSQLYEGVPTKDRVAQAALYEREVLLRKTGTEDILGDRLS